MKKPRLALLFCVCATGGCEPPWKLLETGTTGEELVAVTRVGDTLWMGTQSGVFLGLEKGSHHAHELNAWRGGATVEGMLGQGNGFWAWTQDALLRMEDGRVEALPVPVDAVGRTLIHAWGPQSAVWKEGTLYVATHAGGTPSQVSLLLEGGTLGFSHAPFADLTHPPIGFVVLGLDGTLWAGDENHGAVTLYKRGLTAWEVAAPLPVDGVLRVVATGDTFYVLTHNGVHALATGGTHEENAHQKLSGQFKDLCVMPDGRVVVVGQAQLPWFSVWELSGRGWANINTGTREALWAVHCGGDGHIYAVGGHGMAVRDP